MISLRFHLTSPFSGTMGFMGVPLRAAFLNLLQQYDPELSNQVHEGEGIRSYSLDPFPLSSSFKTDFDQGSEYQFGVNLFAADRYGALIRSLALVPKEEVRIHHYYFPLRKVDFCVHRASELMDAWIEEAELDGARNIGVEFKFLTPTQLSQYGSDMAFLMPTPEKVFSGLLRVWNTIDKTTAVQHVSDYRKWVEANIYVSGYRLHTVKVTLGRGRAVVGFVGVVNYEVENADSPFGLLSIGLSKFSEMCNVGKNRTAGLGKVTVELNTMRAKKERRGGRPTVFVAGRGQA